MLNVYYINLEGATDRRTALEKNLAQFASNKFAIHRINAFDKSYVKTNAVPGKISDSEKGCFLSHIKAIEMSLERPGPALILEDDARLFTKFLSVINKILPQIESNSDLTFLDITVSDFKSMCILNRIHRELTDSNEFNLLRTSDIDFSGSAAYLLTDNSKKKILNTISQCSVLDEPYDIFLKRLIKTNEISSGFVFPLIATKSDDSLNSSVQQSGDFLNIVWHSFSKLMFCEFDVAMKNSRADIDLIPESILNERDKLFGKIATVLLSKNFPVITY